MQKHGIRLSGPKLRKPCKNNLVVNTFGMYAGKVLERIMHNEEPWEKARKGYGDGIPSSELLPKKHIMKYFVVVNQKY